MTSSNSHQKRKAIICLSSILLFLTLYGCDFIKSDRNSFPHNQNILLVETDLIKKDFIDHSIIGRVSQKIKINGKFDHQEKSLELDTVLLSPILKLNISPVQMNVDYLLDTTYSLYGNLEKVRIRSKKNDAQNEFIQIFYDDGKFKELLYEKLTKTFLSSSINKINYRINEGYSIYHLQKTMLHDTLLFEIEAYYR